MCIRDRAAHLRADPAGHQRLVENRRAAALLREHDLQLPVEDQGAHARLARRFRGADQDHRGFQSAASLTVFAQGEGAHEWSKDCNRQIFRIIQRVGGGSSRSDSKRHKKARGASRRLFQYMNRRGSGRAQNTGGNSPSRSGRQTTSEFPLQGAPPGSLLRDRSGPPPMNRPMRDLLRTGEKKTAERIHGLL